MLINKQLCTGCNHAQSFHPTKFPDRCSAKGCRCCALTWDPMYFKYPATMPPKPTNKIKLKRKAIW